LPHLSEASVKNSVLLLVKATSFFNKHFKSKAFTSIGGKPKSIVAQLDVQEKVDSIDIAL
jgi:hypothetical protein